jgi:hypothetical protein
MTMWRLLKPVEDDVSDLPAIDPENKHRRHAAALGVTGLCPNSH